MKVAPHEYNLEKGLAGESGTIYSYRDVGESLEVEERIRDKSKQRRVRCRRRIRIEQHCSHNIVSRSNSAL